MQDYPLDTLQDIIVPAAREELLPRFAAVVRAHKADGSVVTEADLALQARVASQLQARWPSTQFLGEEMTPARQQATITSRRPVWCLDPLDGTSNFATGIPYFCVSLALLQDGVVRLGLVYDPVRDECFTADADSGARLNGARLALTDSGLMLDRATALVDFKRLDMPLAMRLVADTPYASQRSFGSVALDWCWLAAGRGHLYLHGRSSVWDYAAGEFIFTLAGGHACTLQGERVFTQALVRRSSVAAVDRPLYTAWTAWLGVPGT